VLLPKHKVNQEYLKNNFFSMGRGNEAGKYVSVTPEG
jgi:hypothetical protein